MNKMGNKIGNEGVMKLLASLPLHFPAHCCPPSSKTVHPLLLPLTKWHWLSAALSVSSSVSTSLYCLLALSFSFTPFLLLPSCLSTYPLPLPSSTCGCQSHSFSLLSDRQWSMGKAVKTRAGEHRAIKCREQRLKRLQGWGWVTELRALDGNKREYLEI